MTCKVYEYTLYTLHGDADEACALRCVAALLGIVCKPARAEDAKKPSRGEHWRRVIRGSDGHIGGELMHLGRAANCNVWCALISPVC
jgi:hypothetical protein